MCELEPQIEGRELPPEVAALREQVGEEHDLLDAALQPSIDAHIDAYAQEVDRVLETHKQIAERTDLEIRADTRWSAIWELSGRCLAICRVVLHDLRGGFTSEAIGSVRTLFEAGVLLGAVAFHEEEEVLRRWLAGEWIRPRQAREVVGRMEELVRERMREDGLEPEGRGTVEAGADIYDLLSQAAHHRRGGLPETVQVDLREFSYGPHPDAAVRARFVDYAGQLLEVTLIIVIDSLGGILGQEYVLDVMAPMQARLEEVRARFPLP